VIVTGTPEQVVQNPASHTGRYLRDVLAVGRANAYGSSRS
jgi:excinuclease UvrABC ATPase subunit